MTTIATRIGAAVTLAATVMIQTSHAYPTYNDGMGNGCVQCHNGFNGGTGALHTNHRDQLGVQTCNLCHPNGGGTTPVSTYTSGTGGALGCAGCHGQDYGETSPNSGQPKATAYGLRQHHVNNGISSCGTGGCHAPGSLGHPNPFPPLFGEDEVPPYYDPIFSGLTDPCSSSDEDMPFDMDSLGLDNDGDGDIDGADLDCAVSGTPTATPSPTSTPAPTTALSCGSGPVAGCIAPAKGVLVVKEKAAGKEKIKVALKKLQPALVPNDFGDPVTGATAYKICIYDSTDQPVGEYTVDQAGALCNGVSCWSSITKGYKYRDKGTSTDGILKINLFGGDAGKGKVIVVGKNKTGNLPTGVASAMQGETSATVQVLSSDASCVGMNLPQVKKADGLIFKATGP